MKGAFARFGISLRDMGYSPIPLWPASKMPYARRLDTTRPEIVFVNGLVNGWHRLRNEPLSVAHIANLADARPALGLAVAGGYGGLVPVDIDTEEPDVVAAIAKVLPRPNVAKAGRHGFCGFYRAEGDIRARKFSRVPGKADAMLVEINITTKSVLPPSIHPDTRAPYRWLTRRTLYNTPAHLLVGLTPDHIEALAIALRPWLPAPRRVVTPNSALQAGQFADRRMVRYAESALALECGQLASMATNSGRNAALFRAACKLGKYITNRVLDRVQVESALLAACTANHVLAEDGEKQCRDSIAQGFKRATKDGLPPLKHWRR